MKGDSGILLSEATTAQLVEELARRMTRSERAEAPEAWCDDCAHFRYGTPAQVDRKDWNPCAKRHTMQFYMPQGHDSPETFGYYVDVCADRTPRPEPTPPAPPPAPVDWTHPDFRQAPPPRGGKPRRA